MPSPSALQVALYVDSACACCNVKSTAVEAIANEAKKCKGFFIFEYRSNFFARIVEIGYTFNPVCLSQLEATPIATKTFPAPPPSFFARPAEVVAPELIG